MHILDGLRIALANIDKVIATIKKSKDKDEARDTAADGDTGPAGDNGEDGTPAAPCRELVAALRASGQDAEIVVYRGARHSFDNVGRRLASLGNVDSVARCRLRTASILGPLLDPDALRACMTKGATVGWSPAATAAPEPDEEPPQMRWVFGSHGFQGVP